MAFVPDTRTYAPGAAADGAVLDAGLRAYMLRVYNWMSSGLLLTGIVAYTIANTSLADLFYRVVPSPIGPRTAPTLLGFVAMFAPLAFTLVLSFGVNRLSRTAVQGLFWAFAAAMGASLANIFVVYAQSSIAQVFFVTAATFAAMSLWGYTTKRDLTGMGSFLMMGLFGIIIASLVSVFVPTIQPFISIIGVLIFVGLTAYDTQRIKNDYVQYAYAEGTDGAAVRSVFDALMLYLNFINIFLFLLQLFGNRNSNN